ncbi:MAG: hypothetical protein AAF632_28090 [Bacteroidota bacterium]
MEKDKSSRLNRIKQIFARKEGAKPAVDKTQPSKAPQKAATPKPSMQVPKTDRGSVEVDSVKHPRQNVAPYRGEITENIQARRERSSGIDISNTKPGEINKIIANLEKYGSVEKPDSTSPATPALQKSSGASLAKELGQKQQAISKNQEKQVGKTHRPDKSQQQKQERNIRMQEHQKQHMQPAQNPAKDMGRDR